MTDVVPRCLWENSRSALPAGGLPTTTQTPRSPAWPLRCLSLWPRVRLHNESIAHSPSVWPLQGTSRGLRLFIASLHASAEKSPVSSSWLSLPLSEVAYIIIYLYKCCIDSFVMDKPFKSRWFVFCPSSKQDFV